MGKQMGGEYGTKVTLSPYRGPNPVASQMIPMGGLESLASNLAYNHLIPPLSPFFFSFSLYCAYRPVTMTSDWNRSNFLMFVCAVFLINFWKSFWIVFLVPLIPGSASKSHEPSVVPHFRWLVNFRVVEMREL